MKCAILLTLSFAGEKQDGSLASLLMFSPTPEGDGEEEGKTKKKKKSETMHFKRLNTVYVSLLGTLPWCFPKD